MRSNLRSTTPTSTRVVACMAIDIPVAALASGTEHVLTADTAGSAALTPGSIPVLAAARRFNVGVQCGADERVTGREGHQCVPVVPLVGHRIADRVALGHKSTEMIRVSCARMREHEQMCAMVPCPY